MRDFPATTEVDEAIAKAHKALGDASFDLMHGHDMKQPVFSSLLAMAEATAVLTRFVFHEEGITRAKQITVAEALKAACFELNEDGTLSQDAANELESDGSIPACCSEGCYTEPDGTCQHGFPSVLVALGVI